MRGKRLSYRIVTRLVNEFKSGREAVKDHHCAGRIASVTTDFSIKLVKEPLKSDRRLSCKEMVQKSEIRVCAHNYLQPFRKEEVSARWLPHRLMSDQADVGWKSLTLIFHGSIRRAKTFYLGLLLLVKRE